ncbi:MAG: flagellar export protein FliJ [Gammaproteobacteria bacterium]|nr:flagellar export protein FliJ [Gammaproteobacteria bacterium]
MTRSKRMQSVVEVTASSERESARVLGELQKRVQAAEQRYQELIRYREDYTQQFANGGSLTVARLQDYRIFLSRLNQAVEQQQQLVERAQQDCAKQRQRWMEIHTRVQALGKVVTRYRDEERSDNDRREQKDSDAQSQQCRPGERDDE